MLHLLVYFSAVAIHCFSTLECSCHFDLKERANVYNCSSTNLDALPSSVPNYTDWVWLENNKIQSLQKKTTYLNRIEFLNLKNNKIFSIPDDFVFVLNQSKIITEVNLADNKLTHLPLSILQLKGLEKLWLSGNPFHCDCDMIWMIGWLNNFTLHPGQHIIVDYQDVRCHSGLMKGLPIFVLNEIEMGCFPSKWTLVQKLGVGIGSGVALLIIIILAILVIRKYREIKFFFYHYFKLCNCITVARGDKNEKLDTMKYDAFLYYR